MKNSSKFSLAFFSSICLMIPISSRIGDGQLRLTEVLSRWVVAFMFTGIIVMMAFAVLEMKPRKSPPKALALPQATSDDDDIEDAQQIADELKSEFDFDFENYDKAND